MHNLIFSFFEAQRNFSNELLFQLKRNEPPQGIFVPDQSAI